MTEDSKGKRSMFTLVLRVTFSLWRFIFLAPVQSPGIFLKSRMRFTLSPLVQSKTMHPLFRAWFSVWGIDVDAVPKVIIPPR
jgi:hypothetical protein